MTGARRNAVRGAISLGIATVVTRALGFLAQLVLARLLAEEHFGVFAFALGIATLAGTLSNLDARRDVQREPEHAASKARAYAIVQGLLGMVLGVALLVGAGPLCGLLGQPAATPYLRALAALPLLEGVLFAAVALAESDMRFHPLARIDCVAVVAQVVVSLALACCGGGAWALVGGLYAAAVMRLAGALALAGRRLARARVRREDLRSVRTFGGALMVASVATAWYWKGDGLLVGATLGFAAAGLYSLAFEIPRALAHVTDNLSRVVLALLGRTADAGQQARVLSVSCRAAFALLAPPFMLGLLHAETLLATLFGPRWTPAADALRILLLLTLLRGTTRHWADLATARGKPHYLAWHAVAIAVAMPVLGWLGMHRLGITGMALGVLGAWLLTAPFWLAWLRRAIPFDATRMLLPGLVALAAGTALGWALLETWPDAGLASRWGIMTAQLVAFAAVHLTLDRELPRLVHDALGARRGAAA